MFTPETHPGLTAEDCAFLNTPLGECDPEKLKPMLAALSQGIADVMGSGLGMDADALFSTFCGRMFLMPDAAAPDASPVAADEPPAQADDTAAQEQPAPDAPPNANAAEPVDDAAASGDIGAKTPVFATCLSGSSFPRRPLLPASRAVLPRRQHFSGQWHSPLRRGLPDSPLPLPARRLCYAACAGPP